MKEDIKRIMQLVKDGKLSPEDAAELIEAFEESPTESASDEPAEPNGSTTQTNATEPPPKQETGAKSNDPFSKFISAVEKIGKDVTSNVNWKDVADQVRTGVNKGVDAIKAAADEASKGKGPFGSVFGSQETKRVELPLAVPSGKILRIENAQGNVVVEGGYDVGAVVIDASFRAYNDEEAKAMSDRYVPVLEETEEAIILKQPESSGIHAEVSVKCPTGTPVVIKLASGDIKVINTEAGVKVNGASGNVKLSRVGGIVEVNTASGDTRIADSQTKGITVESKSGDVVCERVTGPLIARTSSGDIIGYECDAKTVNIEAASGDITLDISRPMEGDLNVRTVSGNIKVDVPDGTNSRFNLSTLRGTVICSLELEDYNQDKMKVTGRSGEGTYLFDVSAVNGDVTVGIRNHTGFEESETVTGEV